MRSEFEQAKDVFLAAIEKPLPDEREAYLREACGENLALQAAG